jgi:threonyl-tRNA synthetase
VQAIVLPITDRVIPFGRQVRDDLHAKGFRATMDARNEKIGHKIREAQLQKIPFMLVLGDREVQDGTISVRHRTEGDRGAMAVDAFQTMLADLVARRTL